MPHSLLLDRIARLYAEKTRRHAKRNDVPNLNERLRNLLRDAIINNDIPKGTTLPPTRKLSENLDLSRSTVIKAYENLKLEGYVESVQGAGYRVKDLTQPTESIDTQETEAHNYVELSEIAKSFSKNVSLINSTDDQSIAFRPGLPPLDVFPVNQWKNLSNGYWRYIKSSALTYSPSAGIELLKQNIASYLNLSRGIKCDPRQILIVSGSLQSLYLIGSVVLDPGDETIMENPTFPNVHSIFDGLRSRITGGRVDEQGMVVSELNQNKKAKPKLIHVTPSSHYPKGVRMSIERRKELLTYASEKGAYIIENDYEHEVHNYGDKTPPIFALDDEHRTIYLSTFNRILHPSIRIGYMVVPPQLLDATEALLKHSHRFVPPSVQVVLNQFIEKNYLHAHVRNVVTAAEERKAIFEDHFNQLLSGTFRLIPNQTRSLHVMAEITTHHTDKRVAEELAKNNIIVHTYSKCHLGKSVQQGIIMGYSSVRPPVIRRKLEDMQRILKNLDRIIGSTNKR
ncbi:MAG: PLP-dependent aminotransferase family protein [Flavobacteriia bacterium]|nr:PLP-dependent aminotransferase family protein [Flavobacteriia bacterium]